MSRRKSNSRKFASGLEQLESRKVMAAFLSADGLWDIRGTGRADEIYIARDETQPEWLIAEINGQVVDVQHESDVSQLQILGRRGNDYIEIDQTAGLINIPAVVKGGGGHDVLIGGSGDDLLIGGGGDDQLIGGAGDDIIRGGAGHDELLGEAGDDTLLGAKGDDYLSGGSGADLLRGGAGHNEVVDGPELPTDPGGGDPGSGGGNGGGGDAGGDTGDGGQTPTTSVRVPAEWETHDSTWMQWPKGEEASYRSNFAGIIGALQAYEQVNLVVESNADRSSAMSFLQNRGVPLQNVQFHIMQYDWSWMRDNGAIWVEKTNADGQTEMVVQDWGFDGWGGDGGPSRQDDAIPCQVAAIEGANCEVVDVVLEKGTLEFNGKDTVITSWTVLHDRNPNMSRAQLENVLKGRFGVSKVVWLEGSSASDITDGHVDGIARFVNENTVVVGRYTDQSDPDSALYENAAATIAAAGFNVVRMDIQGYVRYQGEWLPANYLNYLVANGVVIASSYNNVQFDNLAKQQLQQLFPNRDIILTDTRELWLNGGAVHCVTNDQPLLASNSNGNALRADQESGGNAQAAVDVQFATAGTQPQTSSESDVEAFGSEASSSYEWWYEDPYRESYYDWYGGWAW